MTPIEPLVTTAEAAKRLGVGVATVRRWAKSGRLTHVLTPSGRILFKPSDLESAYQLVEKSA